MLRAQLNRGSIILILSLIASPCRAETGGIPDDGAFFDGGSGAAVELPPLRFKPSRSLAAPAKLDMSAYTKQSGADLFYFTPEEAAEGRKRFGTQKLSPGAADYTFDRDVPPDIQTQMRADLAFIEGIEANDATPLHRQIFGAATGANYIGFFKSRVTGIGMSDCGGGNAVACVIPFWNPSKMWLTKNFIRFSHPQIARMMVVFHEARHTESRNGNWPHARCPNPFRNAQGDDMRSIWTGAPLAGEPACDKSYSGSYGSSTIMLRNIQRHCANCTDKVRMDAGLYADDQLGRITDARARREMEQDSTR